MKKNKKMMILILCGVIAMMAVGYSLLSSTLNITGRAKIMMNWRVFISDIHEVKADNAETKRASVDSMLSASFEVDLKKPGSYAVYDVTVKNQGEMDAVLKAIQGLDNETNNRGIKFSVKNLTIDEPLLSHTEKIFQVRVEWDPNAAEIPNGTQNLKLDLDYTQTEEGTGDITKPEANPKIKDRGTNYITIDSGCLDSESGIKNVEYKEGNNDWQSGTSIQIFENLKSGNYRYQIRCTNGMNLTTISNVLEVATKDLESPTYSINKEGWATQKELTITYPIGQDNYNYEYSLDGGTTWNKTTSTTTVLTFTENGSVIARISDGTNTKTASAFAVEQVDSSKPTAPILDTTQVNPTWSNEDQTITIESNGSSPSGLDHYEYYVSTSKDGLENGTWISLPKDESTITISDQDEHYVYVREVNGAGTKGEISDPVRVQIDKTKPENVEPTNIETTTKSITVAIEPLDNESGITKIEFSKDGGKTWVDQGTNPNYTFENLESGSYDIVVRVTNGSGLTKTSEIKTVSTTTITAPTYSVDTTGWATNKTVTITYPERQTDFIYEYSTDGGTTWTTVSSGTTATVEFTSNGSVVARVRDGVNTKTASTYTVDKIDTDVPTAPTITGGSNSWTSGTRTISVSNASTSASGIKNYQYYISTSSTTQTEGTWINLTSGTTSIKVSNTGTHYVFMRAINNVGTIGTVSSAQTVKIDTTSPSASLSVQTKTTKSVTLSATCADSESGITKYEFSKDDGTSWTSNGTTSTYKFGNLATGTYNFKVRCTNGSGLTKTSDRVSGATNEITAPTYSINTTGWASSKTVTITYPTRQTDFVYEYSIDGGTNWTTVSSGTSATVEFTSNGSVVARVRDGVNTKTASTYTVDKIDTGVPTAPTITGGSDSWSGTAKTISVSKASTSTSGIKNYQYYISTSSSSQTGGTWTNLASGATSVSISTNGTRYIFMRAVNNAGTAGAVSAAQTTKIDTGTPTAPTITGGSTTWSASAKTISVSTASTSTSGIKNYQYYISTSSTTQTGGTWTNLASDATSVSISTNGTRYIFMRAINNAGTTGTVSVGETTKIDTGTPTAPAITGGSATWSTSAKTISVNTASTSASGIKNYQYYISTSSTSQTGGTWINLSSGTTSIKVSNVGTHYVFMRAVNNVGTVGTVSAAQTVKIDTTAPTGVSVGKGTVTTKSIQVTANGSDTESGITKYEFSKDNGSTWINNGMTKTYTFSNLTTGTYNIKVRLTNAIGKTTTSDVLAINTIELTTPTYSINTTEWSTSKTVTITYPTRQTDFVYEYSIDGGTTWTTVSSGTTATVDFTANGSVVARVRDGVNTKTASTYTVDKIDTDVPTAPTITGGSTTWSASAKTISVSTASTSTSAIKNYQYYISTSSTSQTGGTWTNLASGTTSVSISTNGTRYIFMRAVNNAGTAGAVSAGETTKIDTGTPTAPAITGGSNSWTSGTRTISVSTSSTSTSGIKNYQYYISTSSTTQTGGTWIDLASDVASVSISTNGTRYIFMRAINNAGTAGVVSAGETTKIDTGTPTAPTITGGSNSWSTSSKTISVSKASISLSGIKNYQYYISTSSDSQTGGDWIDLSSGITSITVSTEGTHYVFMRAINNVGKEGNVSTAQTVKIDTTSPSASLSVQTKTTKSVTLSATCADNESGITKYEFSKDDGTSWTSNGTTSTYKFGNLTTGTYNFKVRCTNGSGLTKTSDRVSGATNEITAPTYSIDTIGWAPSKTVTITYPARQTDFVYEYSIDGGTTWTTVSSGTSAIVEFTSNGSVVARVRDGVNTKTASTYTVDKIDTDVPTAPTITGGSTTWSTSAKTISVSTASTSTSGIKNYQYYISTSSTTQTGGTWTNLASGTTSITVSTEGTHYVFMRAINNAGVAGTVSAGETTKIDTGTPTAPAITGGSDTWSASAKTISVSAASTSTSGIKNYQYYISTSNTSQTGGTWTDLASDTTSVSINTNGTRYIFMRAINNAGTAGKVSSVQTTKIDTGTPTAPAITGGSNSWTSGTRTISVNTASTSTSGIKNYQYYISTSSSSQTGGTWTNLASGTTSIKVSTEGTHYVFMRAINNVEKEGKVSAAQTVKIDTTASSASLSVQTKTTKSITVSATCVDNESGITKYEFSKDDGTNWTSNGTTSTYKFGNLATGTYNFKVRCTNGSGLTKTSDRVNGATNEITAPTYSINTTGWASSKTVTITYPTRQTDFVYEYSIDGGSTWTTVSSGTSATVEFTSNGSVVARVRDGVNTKTASTYTVDNIDKDVPTAPTITGGSTTWSTSAKTISVSTASTSTSGIKNYQYYISTSSTTQTGGTWTNLASGTTSITVSTEGTHYVFMRAINNAGTAGVVSSAQTTKIDTGTPTAPTITGGSTTWSASTKTISVSTASTSTSGIKNYQYYISTSSTTQTGGTWTNLASGATSVSISTNGTRYIFMRAVNNAGTAGTISAGETTKIDTGTPTAPTITGGSNSWSTSAKTISVSTVSTSTSGIKNYQYYISTSSTTQTGGEWIDLANGTTSIKVSAAGTHYVFMRAVNTVGTVGTISTAQTVKIDTTSPSASLSVQTKTTKSITLSATCVDNESGITKYEFSKDDGTNWISNGTTSTYKFGSLATGTYNFKVRCTNGSGLTKTSDRVSGATNEITAPTYSINTTGWATSKTVTITYPERQTDFVYEYSIDGGSTWTTVSSGTSATVEFTSNGSVVARVRDGVNTKTASTYTVDKIDTGTPTAPTITGGSDTWSASAKTISVSTASTSTSGIKNYQYYISTSSTTQTGGTWTNLASGATSVSINTNGTRYIFMRAVNNAGIAGTVSTGETTKIDTGTPTAPTITGGSTTWINGTRTITVSEASTSTSGIKNYQYYISTSSTSQTGGSWTNLASGATSVSISTNGTRYIFMRAVNNAGIAGTVSAGETTKIDTGTPTAPAITGGSTTWSTSAKTISVSTASTSASGIKNYQYYISTSSTTQTGGTWTNLASGTTSIKVSTAGTHYVFMRAINNVGTLGTISSAQTVKIDTTAPTGVSVGKGTVTTKSIQVTANGSDAESGITKYEFSKDNGSTWINNGMTKTYTFSNLTTGTYNIKVRLTNGIGQTTTSNVLAIATIELVSPTYSINTTEWATSKTVTITYPTRQTDFVYEYSTNGGTNWTTVSSGTTATVEFTANGSVVARVRDGVNTKTSSSYTVDKIDTGTPTAPTITGGSTTWTSGTRTISVSKASTSTSGIKNYQYYISTSSTTQAGGTWTNLATGTTSVSISTNGTRYIFMRAVNNAGTAGAVSAGETTKIDTGTPTAPAITGGSNSWTSGTRTISVSTSSTSTSGIKNYQYYISTSSDSQTGGTWTNLASDVASVSISTNGTRYIFMRAVNNAGTAGKVSAGETTKIDTGTPTAPAITGGSNSWSTSAKTISVSTASTSLSGIKNYQYYISTSSTTQTGGTWTNLASGTTSITVSTEGTHYVFMRAINTVGTLGTISSAQTVKIDTTSPSASLSVQTKTTKSVTLSATCADSESGITKYEFSKDDGTSWTSNGTTSIYKFGNLATGTYNFKVRCTNGSGLTKTSDRVNGATNEITAPTYSIDTTGWAPSKTVTITYPARQTDFVYEYSIDGGSTWTTVSSGTTATVDFTSNGSVVARVRDGVNTKTASSYTVDKIDTGTPTAPTITGGSTTWSASAKTISVSKASTSTSGIKNYQYYISTSSTTQVGGTWTNLASGTTSVSISTNGTRYIFMRAVNNAGTAGKVSAGETTKIDTGTPTAPTITGGSTTWSASAKTISVSTASTSTSGIKNYQYYISTSSTSQTGGTWIDLASDATSVSISTNGTRYIFMRAINNAGTAGKVSSVQTTKIDTGTPTAPTITGGSNSWSTSAKTISVSTASTSASGIKNYQYYISTSSTTQTGGTWTNLASGTTSIKVSTEGTHYVFMRAINNVEKEGKVSTAQTVKIDTTASSASLSVQTKTTKSITLSATCADSESGITKYEFSKDDGTNWTSNGTTSTYKFGNLTTGTYNFKVRCTNGSGLTKTSDRVSGTTNDITAPTYSINTTGWASSKTVTITYPTRQTDFVYEYSIDGGSTWTTVSSGTTATVDFTSNGSIVARVRDGVNTKTASTYTVDKIDTDVPTAPTITGGSNSWTSGTRTISVNTASTSTSGIKNYQYYISTSSTNQTGGTWTNLASGTTRITVSTEGTHYVFMRAINNAGTAGVVSLAQTTKIDTGTPTAPTITGGSTTWSASAKTISVSTASTSTSGIKNYQYYISTSNTSQTGGTWTNLASGATSVSISTNGTRYIFMRAVNNAGTAGVVSTAQTTKIDTGTPTAPTITGGSTTWTSGTRTISVSAASTSTSGIKNYQYYISTSSTTQTGGTWTNLASGTTSITVSTEGTHYVFMRAINNVGKGGTISSAQTVKIDTTASSASLSVQAKTTKSITLSATCTDNESGITKYEFSKDDGTSWTSNGTTSTYRFESLATGTYNFKVRCTNGSGLTKTSDRVTGATNEITAPTYSINTTGWATSKTVTITYPTRQTDFVYEYSIDGGSTWTTVSSGTSATVNFAANGNVVARVRDGVNTKTASTYTVDKIDTGTPTAPTITGGSTTWSASAKTISVSTASTSTSGIKNYQYYISTSSTTQTGGTWTNLASGTTSVSITTNGTRYIFMRAVNNAGTAGVVSLAQTTKIDTGTPTAPTLTGGSTTWTSGTRTISVSTASTSTSGIKNYQYYISTSSTTQTGGTWTNLASGTTSVSINTNGTRYIFMRAVNNAGTAGAVSSAQTTKIDTGTPTAPTLTGGSTTWTSGTRTISVSGESTSPSGIKNYQYYISTSSTSQTGGTWTDLASGTTSIKVSTVGTHYVFMRAINNVETLGTISAAQIVKIDTTAPTGVSVGKGTVTTKSIQVTANGSDSESGITKYEFSKDNGSTWINNGTTKTYTFSNLTTGTYNIKVRLTNGIGQTTTSSASSIATTTIIAPTYSINTTGWATSKTVTITYPTRQTDFVYEYSIDGGSTWTTVSSGTTATVKFTANGNVVARVRDGVNTKTASSYTVDKIDTGIPTAPTITGGSDSWSASAKTISVSKASTSTSGIKNYQYYVSTSSTTQAGGTWTNLASGATSVSISTNGTRYIFMRAVNNAGTAGKVSAGQTTKIDTGTPTAPTITGGSDSWSASAKTISVSTASTSTSGIKNYQYYISTSSTTQTGGTWTNLASGATSVSINTNGTRYIFMRAVNNAGTAGAVSSAQTTKIDTGTPTAPTITGGSTTWTSGTRTISVSTVSTSASGIKNYQYYISTSSTSQTGGSWTDLASGTTSIKVSTAGTHYVFMRAVNTVGTLGTISSVQTVKIDTTSPSASLSVQTKTTKSVTLSATCADNESGITKYEFSKDDGTSWISNGTTSTYKFGNLATGTYNFKVRCTNGSGLTKTSDRVSGATNEITAPTYSINTTGWASSKTVTITYPTRQTDFVYEYSIDGGTNWTTVSSGTTATVNFTSNGSVVARVRDGVNTKTASTYTVDKIDTGVPTAPTITGGSDTWSASAKTISVSKASTSTSGIKNYQYYISTSSTTQTGGTWTNLASGTTSVSISTNGIRYIFMRAVNNAGTAGAVSAAQTTKIDTGTPTAPTITGGSTTWINGTRTITVSEASTSTSGIKNYQYYISTSSTSQTGGTWTNLAGGATSVSISTNGTRYIFMRAVNNAGTAGTVSAGETTKIDTGAPTAPTLTGGSTAWTSGTRTISVSTASTSASGIKNYQYYISTSSTTQTGGTWTNLASGTTSIKVSAAGTHYVFMRAVNTVGTLGKVSTAQTVKIDTTAPTGVSVGKGTVTTKSIQVTANGSDAESGITKYEFSKDNGSTWIDNGTTKTYTFSSLTTGTYNIKVRLTNGIGQTTTSAVSSIATAAITAPTYSINTTGWATRKTVTITYPTRQTDFVYEYSTNGGTNWTTVSSGTTATVNFTSNGSVVARVRDGVNTKTASSYTVDKIDTTVPTGVGITQGTITSSSIQVTAKGTDAESGITKYEFSKDNGSTWISNSTNKTYTFTGLNAVTTYNIKVRLTNGAGLQTTSPAVPIVTPGNLAKYLKNNKVVSNVTAGGNGLVAIDSTGEITTSSSPREYRYIGSNPDNYVKFNNELWRIIGIFDGQVKIIRANVLDSTMAWDKGTSAGGTHGTYGWNDWTQATLQTYLNGEYLNSIDNKSQRYISNYTWNLGGARNYTSSSNGLAQHFYEYERGTDRYDSTRPLEWSGKIALMYVSDYGFATSGGSTTNRSSCLAKELYNWDSSSVSDCKNNSWLFNSSAHPWTLNADANNANFAFNVRSNGYAYSNAASTLTAVRPSLFLNSKVEYVGGTGTSSDPYRIDMEPTASEHLIDNKVESNVDAGGNGLVAIDSTGEITTSSTPREYRYIGSNPDNYVSFNNELWRIIGIFNGQVKIIRVNKFDTDMEWDDKGENDWSKASLQTYLNGEYLDSIDNTSKSYISDYTWKLGGSGTSNDVTAQMFYERERGTKVLDGKPTEWTGKIALMYPSDYGFATSGGSTTNRSSCLAKELYNWDSASECYNNSWLYDSSSNPWTLTPDVSDGNSYAFNVLSDGFVAAERVYYISSVRPSLYLKSKVKFIGGSGTSSDPYRLDMKPTAAEYLIDNKVESNVSAGGNGLVALDNSGAITTNTSPREYRYIGSNPNNYVKFNNELWRVIGIFDGQLKIIRANALDTNMAWDSNNSNNWSQASLKTYLNGNYYNSVDASSKSMIFSITWNLGGADTHALTAQQFYEKERGTNVYSGNPTKWTGNIALMYPSDYGFATSGGSTTNRNSCLATVLWNLGQDCYNNNWLNSSSSSWLLTPQTNISNYLFFVRDSVYSSGYAPNYGATKELAIRPSLYLKSDVERASGSGTSADPYILK